MEQFSERIKALFKIEKPVAITMWDFSWIERRWPGAGYGNWDKALNELAERGYDAVRIDAFPHLMAWDAEKEWTLKPVWNTQDWGSRYIIRLTIHNQLRNFLKACRRHNIRVALSTWFREDLDNTRMSILSPEDHAEVWIKTLDYIKEWGELDNILYVDLCNEFPHRLWSPFFTRYSEPVRNSEASVNWMRQTIRTFKEVYSDIPVTFSFTSPFFNTNEDVSFLDFLEPHIWMTNSSEFYEKVGYHFELFDDTGYTNLALKGEQIYWESKEHYDKCLIEEIQRVAEWSKNSGKPVITTECWSVVDYKDAALLNWNWILDLNRLGVLTATGTGRWAGMATSNFCGPQFHGMWSEREWHLQMTDQIHKSKWK